jgi:hypothetical protein
MRSSTTRRLSDIVHATAGAIFLSSGFSTPAYIYTPEPTPSRQITAHTGLHDTWRQTPHQYAANSREVPTQGTYTADGTESHLAASRQSANTNAILHSRPNSAPPSRQNFGENLRNSNKYSENESVQLDYETMCLNDKNQDEDDRMETSPVRGEAKKKVGFRQNCEFATRHALMNGEWRAHE